MYHVIAREEPVCQEGLVPVITPTLLKEGVFLKPSGHRFDFVACEWVQRDFYEGAKYAHAAYEDLCLHVGGPMQSCIVAAIRVRRVIREEARHGNPVLPVLSAETVLDLRYRAQKEAQAPTPPALPSLPTLSLREYYAGKFLAARLGTNLNLGMPEEMAQAAVQRADALIAELNKTKS